MSKNNRSFLILGVVGALLGGAIFLNLRKDSEIEEALPVVNGAEQKSEPRLLPGTVIEAKVIGDPPPSKVVQADSDSEIDKKSVPPIDTTTLIADAGQLQQDWRRIQAQASSSPPEERNRLRREWRDQNFQRIEEIEAGLGGVMEFPELANSPSRSNGLPVPAAIAARRTSPVVRAFDTERMALIAEREGLGAEADLPEKQRLELISRWEVENEERLRNHRQHAHSLGLLNFELYETERRAISVNHSPTGPLTEMEDK